MRRLLKQLFEPQEKTRTPEEAQRTTFRRNAATALATRIREHQDTLVRRPTRIILFGSVALGNDRLNSDTDVAVIVEGETGLKPSEEMALEKKIKELAREVAEERFGPFEILPFHLACASQGTFDRWREDSAVISRIHRDGIDL
jgi:predicted nucleotidyltransferase